MRRSSVNRDTHAALKSMRFVALLAKVVPHSWIVTPVTADAEEATQQPAISASRAAHTEFGHDEPEAE
jgi:hypothetical protein